LYESNIFQCCPEIKVRACLLCNVATSFAVLSSVSDLDDLTASADVFRVTICCLVAEQYKHACECAEDEVPDLLVDVDDAGCTLGKSCAGCSKMIAGRDYSRHGHSNTGPRKAIGKRDAHWHPPEPSWLEGEIVAFSAAGLVGIGILYGRRRALSNNDRTQGRKYGRLGRD
jgi:hypothetical protein